MIKPKLDDLKMLILLKILQIFSGILAILALLVLIGFTDGFEGFFKLFTNPKLLINIASDYPPLILYMGTFVVSIILFFVFRNLHIKKIQEIENSSVKK